MKAQCDISVNGLLAKKRAELFKGIETNPVPVKDLMAYAGLCNADVRLPLVGLEDKNHDQLIQTFDVTKRRLGLG